MQWLELPAIGDEPAGEVVEQLGMRGFAAEETKVARRVHDAVAEVMLPHAVREHARGERVVVAGDPFCERKTTLAFGGVGL